MLPGTLADEEGEGETPSDGFKSQIQEILGDREW